MCLYFSLTCGCSVLWYNIHLAAVTEPRLLVCLTVRKHLSVLVVIGKKLCILNKFLICNVSDRNNLVQYLKGIIIASVN